MLPVTHAADGGGGSKRHRSGRHSLFVLWVRRLFKPKQMDFQ